MADKETRSERQYMTVTPTEKARIKELATAQGISPGNYSRQRVLGTLKTRADVTAIRQLANAGNNLNQISKFLHGGADMDALKDELSATMTDVRAAVHELCKKEVADNDND
ncbi:plasmid mobilization relaxosome protein MobC [Pseudomonadota bacterium]